VPCTFLTGRWLRTIGRAPNQPKTPHRSVCVDDAYWTDLDDAAVAVGTDRAKLIVAFIRLYLHRPGAELAERPRSGR
jgi:hypothetical protein